MNCPRCKVLMTEGTVLVPGIHKSPDDLGGSVVTVSEGPATEGPVPCMKCPECGHSVVGCSSFCHPEDPCAITEDGRCDALPPQLDATPRTDELEAELRAEKPTMKGGTLPHRALRLCRTMERELNAARTPIWSHREKGEIMSKKMESETPVEQPRLVLPFELALTRWSVVCIIWRDLASDHPNLTAFLAGWGCRCIGATMPETIESFRDSFRVGWREADTMIAIEMQRQNANVIASLPSPHSDNSTKH